MKSCSGNGPLADMLRNEIFKLLLALLRCLNFIPAEFKSHRFHYIAEILNSELDTTYSTGDILTFVNSIEGLFVTHEIPSADTLWQVTLTKGMGCMEFLAPPTSNCLKCGKTLHVHNEPVTVLCFKMDGPTIASKITLRCSSCHTNYR